MRGPDGAGNRTQKNRPRPVFCYLLDLIGRGDRIRTCDFYVPNIVHFATKVFRNNGLRSDWVAPWGTYGAPRANSAAD